MQKYECKNCGAELKWSATAGALECEYCGEVYNPEDFEDQTLEADKSDEKEHLVDKEYATTSTTDEEVIYKCDECGAEVVALQTTMATECPYCGRPISLTHTHKGSFRPEKVVPYKIEKDEAIKLLKEFFGKSPFTPKEFKEQVQIEQVKGLYVPFYLHSYHVKGDAVYKCEIITSERKGDDRVNTHKVYDVRLKADVDFNRVPVDGATTLDDNIMFALEPFQFDGIKEYNPAYMAGYYADQPDETAESTKERAVRRGKLAVNEQYVELLKKYDKRTREDGDSNISNYSSEYAMLPIWRLNAKYRGEIYQFSVNGQTGKVIGKTPISISKIVCISGLLSLLTFLGGFIFL